MEFELISLLCIVVVAFICPLISSFLPNKLIPETVFLLLFGMLLGPNVAGIIDTGDAISLLSDLGLSFLFLLAGYEIDPKTLRSSQGKHGFFTWIASFAVTMLIVFLFPGFSENPIMHLALGIALTTTAYGTIVPILHERNIVGTKIGDAVIAYGTWGELCPIIAIALLLSSRSAWVTGIVLLAFAILAITSAVIPKKLAEKGTHMVQFVQDNSDTNSQMTVRGVMILLMGLVCISALFGLDIVLGAFAAGFALRAILPHGNEGLEIKLQGIGYGFFVPLFFIISGTKIDPSAVATSPLLLLAFIALLILMRAVPIYIGLSLSKESHNMSSRNKATVSLYCTTALPLIVAVTSVAVSSGAMSQQMASVLISAGGISVLLMPLLASLTLHTIDAEMGEAIKAIGHSPKKTITILKAHHQAEKEKRPSMVHVLSKTKNKKHSELLLSDKKDN